jgi:hypothetical protein
MTMSQIDRRHFLTRAAAGLGIFSAGASLGFFGIDYFWVIVSFRV